MIAWEDDHLGPQALGDGVPAMIVSRESGDHVTVSTDPMIVVARLVDAKAREARKRYETEVAGVEISNYAKIARALFDTEGNKVGLHSQG